MNLHFIYLHFPFFLLCYNQKGGIPMNPIAGAWFVALLLFLWLEASTVGIVSIWFAVGALCAMVTGICGGELWLQVVVFTVVSIALLASLRPLTRKYFKPKLFIIVYLFFSSPQAEPFLFQQFSQPSLCWGHPGAKVPEPLCTPVAPPLQSNSQQNGSVSLSLA